uniref:Rootletin-like coiled-coil domain-containing protein n=1 Tax=Anas platyrhynchos TaxID=8839 RepID=A0A8B9QU80_ANAPL
HLTRIYILNEPLPLREKLVFRTQLFSEPLLAARSQASLWRRLQSSEEAQQRQAVLVRKLQEKVRGAAGAARGRAGRGSLPDKWEPTEDHNLEKALLQLEEEQRRCENLAEVNTLLREHLDKANEVNSALKEDVGKLTADWMRARKELELKESEWHNEREFYDSYLRGEHNRLLSLWRQVVTFRRHFVEMKTATDRDLSELKAEQIRLSGSILVNCFRLNSGIQLWESITLGRPILKDQAQQQMEREINQKTLEVMCLQIKGDLEKKELQDRVMELSALLIQSQKQNEEKEKTMKTLNNTVEILEFQYLCLHCHAKVSLELCFLSWLLDICTPVLLGGFPNPPRAMTVLFFRLL